MDTWAPPSTIAEVLCPWTLIGTTIDKHLVLSEVAFLTETSGILGLDDLGGTLS